MYYTDYTALKAQQKVLQEAFKNGRISEEVYNSKVKELNKKIGILNVHYELVLEVE